MNELELEQQLKLTDKKLQSLRKTNVPKQQEPMESEVLVLQHAEEKQEEPQIQLLVPNLLQTAPLIQRIQQIQQIQSLQQQFQQLTQILTSIQTFKKKSDAEVSDSNRQIEQLQKSYEELQYSIRFQVESNQQLYQMGQQTSTKALEINLIASNLLKDLEQQNKSSIELERENVEMKNDNEKLKKQVKDREMDLKKKTNQLRNLEEMASGNGEMKVLLKQISSLEQARAQLDADIERMRAMQ